MCWVRWRGGLDAARGPVTNSLCQRTCPPKSHILIVTPPFVTLRMLNPTVGIVSSWKPPVASTATSDDLPAFCRPTSDSSISRRKNRLSWCLLRGGGHEGLIKSD